MTAEDDRQTTKLLRLQAEMNKHMAATLKEIERIAKDSIEYTKSKQGTPGRAITEIKNKCVSEREYLLVKSSQLEDVKKKRLDKNQDKLFCYE